MPIVVDISKSEQIKSVVDKTLTQFGRVDILVNDVGCAPGKRVLSWTCPTESEEQLLVQQQLVDKEMAQAARRALESIRDTNPGNDTSAEKQNIISRNRC